MKTINLTEEQAVIVMHALQTEVSTINKEVTDIQLEILDRENRAITDEDEERIAELTARLKDLGEIANILHNA